MKKPEMPTSDAEYRYSESDMESYGEACEEYGREQVAIDYSNAPRIDPSNDEIWQHWKDADAHVLSFARKLLSTYGNAPQVAQGDERASLRGAANLAFSALHECKPNKGAEKQVSDAIQALTEALHDIAYSINRTATPQQFSDHLQREARAALSRQSAAPPHSPIADSGAASMGGFRPDDVLIAARMWKSDALRRQNNWQSVDVTVREAAKEEKRADLLIAIAKAAQGKK